MCRRRRRCWAVPDSRGTVCPIDPAGPGLFSLGRQAPGLFSQKHAFLQLFLSLLNKYDELDLRKWGNLGSKKKEEGKRKKKKEKKTTPLSTMKNMVGHAQRRYRGIGNKQYPDFDH